MLAQLIQDYSVVITSSSSKISIWAHIFTTSNTTSDQSIWATQNTLNLHLCSLTVCQYVSHLFLFGSFKRNSTALQHHIVCVMESLSRAFLRACCEKKKNDCVLLLITQSLWVSLIECWWFVYWQNYTDSCWDNILHQHNTDPKQANILKAEFLSQLNKLLLK